MSYFPLKSFEPNNSSYTKFYQRGMQGIFSQSSILIFKFLR